MDFLKWYKNKIESGDQEPPENVWNNIHDELDIERSWDVINNYLSRKSVTRRAKIFAAAAGFLVLISVGTYWYFRPDNKSEQINLVAEDLNEKENEILDSETDLQNQVVVEEKREEQVQPVENKERRELLVDETVNSEPLKVEKEERKVEENISNQPGYVKLDNRAIAMNSGLNKEIIVNVPDKNYSEENVRENSSFKKLYIGSAGQLANTWLLNEKTFTGFERSSLISSNASFGSNFGVFFGTNLTKRLDLQLDINILVQNNQVYNEYLNGHYIENKLRFNYSQLALSVRYNFMAKRFLKGEHGINAGGYTGYLHNAYQNIDGKTINLSSNYNRMDYGIFLSYEYVIPIYKQLGLGTGFRVYYGLQNTYSGNETIPSYLNKTHNAFANISFSLKYSIK